MKKAFGVLTLMMCLWGFSSASIGNVVPFSDNFDSENGGVGKLNYSGFTNWTIVDGTVDLIGNGYWDFLPGNGLYVDLDGSTHNPGQMISSNSFDLQPGTYMLSFYLAGNQHQSPQDQVTVQLAMGSLLNNTYTLTNFAPFTLFTETITVTSATFASLTFENAGSDNIGMLLDNVSLELVPEPATIALLAIGGVTLLRRKLR